MTDIHSFTVRFLIHIPGFEGSYHHITLTFLGVPSTEAICEINELFTQLINLKPIRFNVTGHDKFGPNSDIPVLLVDFENSETRNLCISFHQKCGVAERNMSFLEVPNYHISLGKNADILSNTKIGTTFTATNVQIKELGPHDPYLSVSL